MKIDLINSEGPILVLVKVGDMFSIQDGKKKEIIRLTREALELFFDGKILIVDSKGVEWNFKTVDNNMKVSYDKIKNFLEINN